MPDQNIKSILRRQSYEMAGSHGRVKICHWTKSDLREKGSCYKNKFYGINSHQCIQMTPTFVCNNACIFCWRDIRYHTQPAMEGGIDNPLEIVEGSIGAQKKQLIGFKGNKSTKKEKFERAMRPQHAAISLDGEPTLYPRLTELVGEYKKRGFSTFVVSNGLLPEKIEKLMEEAPTQLYISVDAPNEELFKRIDRPIIKDAWKGLMKTLGMLPKIRKKTRTALRLTLIRGINMVHAEQWAEIIKLSDPMFVEAKAYMHVGMSKQRLEYEDMPSHEEVKKFAEEIAKHAGYKLIDEHKPSRVVLLMKKDLEGRIMRFD